jgi:hypothetical protein
MKEDNVYLSIIKRVDCTLCVYFLRFLLIFTKFASASLQSNRSVVSRFALYELIKLMGIPSDHNYCFSHSGKISAMLVAPSTEKIAIDIEPSDRKLSKSLNNKIRKLYPDTSVSELGIIMMFECLIKLSLISSLSRLAFQTSEYGSVKIIPTDNKSFEVTFRDAKVFSRIYNFNNLLVCITREKNQFPMTLNVLKDMC